MGRVIKNSPEGLNLEWCVYVTEEAQRKNEREGTKDKKS